MVLIQLDLTDEADKNVKVYMANNHLLDKRNAINHLLENLAPNNIIQLQNEIARLSLEHTERLIKFGSSSVSYQRYFSKYNDRIKLLNNKLERLKNARN